MAVNVTYREANPVVPTVTTIKNSPLSNQEIDGNFKSIKDAIDPLGTSAGAGLVGIVPAGGIAAITVQGAIDELDTEKASLTSLAASSGSSLVGYDGGTVQDVLDAVTGPNGAASVGYTPAGTGAVATTVQSKLRESVSVKDFGAVGDGSDETSKIQAALDYMKATGITLDFEPKKTYVVSQVTILSAGQNYRSNWRIRGNGATLQGNNSSSAFKIYRTQGLNIHGLRVVKHASATYASELTSFWYGNFVECEFGETRLHAEDGWGTYWNEFNGCAFNSILFDLTNNPINQNIWKGGVVGGITKTNAGHPTYKEAYNNVFIGVDILGAIDWRDASSSFHDPIVFRDCNMEYAGVNYGQIISVGGRANPMNAGNTQLFPWDDLRSEYNMQYSGGMWSTGWFPWSSVNLFRGGACQSFSPDIISTNVGNLVTLYADATSPTGNGYCYRGYYAGAASPRIRLRMPVEYLEQAKKVGFVSFSFWVYNVNGAAIVANTTGTIPTGDAYPNGVTFPTNQWVQRFVSVPVSSSATDASLYIGAGNITGFDVRIANVAINLGKVARPYAPAPNEPHAKRAMSFQKTLVASGTAQNTFTLSVPSDGLTGRVRIKAFHANADSVAVYEVRLAYARQNGIVVASVVQTSKAQSGGYGGGNAGCVDSITASVSGGTITIATTVTSYPSTPNRDITYDVEFLDRNETLTVL